MSNEKLKPGDTVWVLDGWARYRRGETPQLHERLVRKVGREYFYTYDPERPSDTYNDKKFHIESMKEFCGPNDVDHYRSTAYRHKEVYEREVELSKARSDVAAFFREHGWERKLTMEQLTAILNIVRQ
jgi:hypothetical protein